MEYFKITPNQAFFRQYLTADFALFGGDRSYILTFFVNL
jgi:hypothetical protein